MNKLSSRCFIIDFIANILILFGVVEAFADHVAPEVQTQVNKRTDLFEKSVNNLPSLEEQLENEKQANINDMGDGKTNTPQGLPFITKKSKGELEVESGQLEDIHENDLNARGREEIIKNNTLNELYPDYSRPLNKQHMKDAKAIAEGQNKLLDDLFAVLKREVGVDCKTIKGDQKHEPEYFLQIKTATHKDTIYNQHICEELRNRYNCNDTLTLTCKVKGIQWGEWQDKEIHVPGAELINFGKEIFWIHRTAPKCFEYKLSLHKAPYTKENSNSTPDPYHVLSMREFLATKHNATIDNISTKMKGSWYGGIFSISGWNIGGRGLGSKDYSWNTYVINYQYREGNPACFDWQEKWDEKCALK